MLKETFSQNWKWSHQMPKGTWVKLFFIKTIGVINQAGAWVDPGKGEPMLLRKYAWRPTFEVSSSYCQLNWWSREINGLVDCSNWWLNHILVCSSINNGVIREHLIVLVERRYKFNVNPIKIDLRVSVLRSHQQDLSESLDFHYEWWRTKKRVGKHKLEKLESGKRSTNPIWDLTAVGKIQLKSRSIE